MTPSDFGLLWHFQRFVIMCHEQTGTAFQKLFESIMVRSDPTFVSVGLSGSKGDWKCDGYSFATDTVYQCYGPENLTAAKATKKILEDFEGAKSKWNNMKQWVVVWSFRDSLPPEVVALLGTLKKANPDIAIDDWSRQHLWNVIELLSESTRIQLLGPIPQVDPPQATTAAEIQVLLRFLVKEKPPIEDDGMSFVNLKDKIDKNRLGSEVQQLIAIALPISRIVHKYVSRHPDPEYSSIVAAVLRHNYNNAKIMHADDPDAVFFKLLEYVSSGVGSSSAHYWPAVGILCYYFQLCDIFEL